MEFRFQLTQLHRKMCRIEIFLDFFFNFRVEICK